MNEIEKNGNEIKEMRYVEYKTSYNGFDTVPGSYNKETKTIKVIVANYDKKVEIIDKLINDLKPNENDIEKMKIYKKHIADIWNNQTHEAKVKALTPHKLAPNAIDARLNEMRDTLIRIANKYGLN